MSFWTDPIVREALVAGLWIAAASALLSVMTLAHRLSFLSVSASHASLAGAGLAALFALPLLPTAALVAVGLAALLALVPRAQLSEDAAASALFAGGMALGAVLLAKANSQGAFFALLFGDILGLAPAEQRILALGAFGIAFGYVLLARAWWRLAAEPRVAEAAGEPVGVLRLLLHVWIGAGVVLAVKAVGVVLAAALLALPAACAWPWARGLGTLTFGSLLAACTALVLGLGCSWFWDWPAGPAIALTLIALWLASRTLARLFGG